MKQQTTAQQPSVAYQRWQAFISLTWYDGLISFLFRFVAKTSEPLLAAGVIVSAADFLQKGQLMANNPTLAGIWAWTQALAIEASTGPVLVFAIQAFRGKDRIKGWLYSVLAALLFIVGSAMLLLQLISSVAGMSEADLNSFVLYGLFALRVIVSAGMVALSCTKHMRFSGDLPEDQEATIEANAKAQEAITQLAEQLRQLAEQQAQLSHSVTQITTSVTEVKTSVTQITQTVAQQSYSVPLLKTNRRQLQLTPAKGSDLHQDVNHTNGIVETVKVVDSAAGEEDTAPDMHPVMVERIKAILADNPKISSRDLGKQLGVSHTTANNWKKRIEESEVPA